MQYVLGVGFIVKKYKKNPRVRIFLDDQMIDELELDENNVCGRPLEVDRLTYKLVDWGDDMWTIVRQVKAQGNKPILHSWKEDPNAHTHPEDLDKTPKYFKLYHIDDSMLEGKKQISLEILNNDSNYTNGFMTRTTTIDIRHVFLLPTELIKHFKPRTEDFKSRAEDFHSHMSKIVPKEFDGLCDFKFCHHGREYNHCLGYPFPIEYKWQMSEEKYDKRENMFLHKVGGSGVLTLALGKMNGVITFDNETIDRVLHLDFNDDDDWAVAKAMQINGATPEEITRKLNQEQIRAFPFSLNFFGLVRTGLLDKYIV